ncbi:MAG: helix-turn-helix domain-containing protein [Candidatus Omnitrophota bacterium]
MGVHHKITPDVLDFIVDTKQENPRVSCREMAERIEEKFQLDISKSTINNIWKERGLNSRVGRRPSRRKAVRKKPRQVFRIPPERKKVIHETLPESFRPKKRQNSDKQVVSARERPVNQLGCIFLAAAEWDLTTEPLLGRTLFQKKIFLSQEDCRRAARVLSFLEALRVDSAESFDENCEVLSLLAGCPAEWIAEHAQQITALRNKRDLIIRFAVEAEKASSWVKTILLTLEDGETISIDAQEASFWSGNVQSDFFCPIERAAAGFARNIFNNVQSENLYAICPKKQENEELINNIIGSFESVPGKRIVQAEFINLDDIRLAQFSGFKPKKRHFIAGIWPWHSLFAEFLGKKRTIDSGRIMRSDAPTELNFQEIKWIPIIMSKKRQLRAILLCEPFHETPFLAVVSNIPAERCRAENIVEQYLKMWPALDKHYYHDLLAGKGRAVSAQDTDALRAQAVSEEKRQSDLALQKSEFLTRYAQMVFFSSKYQGTDVHTMRNRFYALNGFWEQRPRYHLVHLQCPERYPYQADLFDAERRFNARDIRSPDGLSLRLSVSA